MPGHHHRPPMIERGRHLLGMAIMRGWDRVGSALGVSGNWRGGVGALTALLQWVTHMAGRRDVMDPWHRWTSPHIGAARLVCAGGGMWRRRRKPPGSRVRRVYGVVDRDGVHIQRAQLAAEAIALLPINWASVIVTQVSSGSAAPIVRAVTNNV